MNANGGHPEEQAVASVFKQCNDLLVIYHNICSHLSAQLQSANDQHKSAVALEEYQALHKKLEEEKCAHVQTRAMLAVESERADCAQAETEIFKKQLEREKDSFEKAFGLFNSKALTDLSKVEELVAKVSALEVVCQHNEEKLTMKDKDIRQLHSRLKTMKESHSRKLNDLHIKAQQEVYMAQTLRAVHSHRGQSTTPHS